MKTKVHVKRGDIVAVLSGAQRGKQGKVLEVLPKKQRAVVEGLNLIKKHERKSQGNPQGKIVEREGTIHVSNLKLITAGEKPGAKKKTAKGES